MLTTCKLPKHADCYLWQVEHVSLLLYLPGAGMIQQQYDSTSMYDTSTCSCTHSCLSARLCLQQYSYSYSSQSKIGIRIRPNPGYDSRTAFLLLYSAFSSVLRASTSRQAIQALHPSRHPAPLHLQEQYASLWYSSIIAAAPHQGSVGTPKHPRPLLPALLSSRLHSHASVHLPDRTNITSKSGRYRLLRHPGPFRHISDR